MAPYVCTKIWTHSESAISRKTDATPERGHRQGSGDNLICEEYEGHAGRREQFPQQKRYSAISSPYKTNGSEEIDSLVKDPARMQLIPANTTGKPTEKYDLLSDDRTAAASLNAIETGVSNDENPTSTDRYDETMLQPNSGRENIPIWGPRGVLAIPSVKIILVIACMVQVRAFGEEAEIIVWAYEGGPLVQMMP